MNTYMTQTHTHTCSHISHTDTQILIHNYKNAKKQTNTYTHTHICKHTSHTYAYIRPHKETQTYTHQEIDV